MNSQITPAQRRALWALSLAYFVQATGALSVAGSLAAISTQWGLSDSESARLLAIFGVTFALGAPLGQVFLGHMMRRNQVLTGMVVFGAGALLFALAPDYRTLALSRVVMGLGAALIGPVLVALGSELVKQEDRGSAIATVLLGVSLASMAGIPLAAWVANLWGARVLFIAVAIASLAAATAIWLVVPNQAAGVPVRFRQVGQVLADGKSLTAFLVVFFITAGVYGMYAFISPIIRDSWHGDANHVSLALTIIGVAGCVGNLFVGRAARYFRAEALLMFGLAVLVADMLIIMTLPGKLALLYLALVFWAFATDILWPTQQRRIVEISNASLRGISLALTSAFMFCGIGFGSAVAAWIYPVAGFYGVMISAIGFLLLALASLKASEYLRAREAAHPDANVCPAR